jgi:glucosamine-6-phosphate deaminase
MTGGDRTDETIKCGISEKYAGKLTVRICENREMMGSEAALSVAEKIGELLQKQPFVNIIFASAPSQNEFLEALSRNEKIPWDRINAFHMDEYIELPEGHPASFASFLNRKLFGRHPFRSVNYINGNAHYIGDECRRYAQLLSEYPPDIVCLGIGENGHLAFNDPPVADFNDPSRVKMVKLDADCRQQQVNDVCFPSLAEVPAYAITLTIPALMAGKYIYCVVPGTQKAKAVYNTLNKEIGEKFPSTILRRHDNAVLFLDKNSGSLL